MNMRKEYIFKQSMALGLDEDGLRRWCNDLILNGPDAKVGAALAILEELDKAKEKRVRAEEEKKRVKDKLDRAIEQIGKKKGALCTRCEGTGVCWTGVGQCYYDCPQCNGRGIHD